MNALRRVVRVVCAGRETIARQEATVVENDAITQDLHRASEEARKLAREVREEERARVAAPVG